jgi:putative nucleotidyltransferase with HDIG domain
VACKLVALSLLAAGRYDWDGSRPLPAALERVVGGLSSSTPEARLEAAISPSVRTLIAATEARDAYTAGHNYRVALYALRLAQSMRLPQESLRALAQGGVIHDVGKIAVPDEVLNKPGRLTEDERAIIEEHPEAGFEMCRHLGFLADELDVIRFHHERWDGTGYPMGLQGEAIPLLARILAIADVYDALTSERAYRKAWSHEEAQRYIAAHAGTQFDPDCVEAWMALHRKELPVGTTVPLPHFGELRPAFQRRVAR